ncbi:LuxR C-terminal-related transcriptional regulator [Nonomuraea rubra]|uniref:DNA-binding NarL/FixJ family response regulator n=1 Tax=Nonomuraea rubra TaxID=46180 RepID=A0A7X0NVN0_9ACTN|nr:LuxR C-terminal-related transcriptional regulator [Nonomuraea rubra]MBB6550450.1 DNA-binding NarL/FixJ family response regulator [Nonomuraea rubra]
MRITRTYPTTAEHVWQLWTTPGGIASWWSPDGFTVEVGKLDLRPGGDLVYTMTATAPEQIAFMESHGMPLSTESRKKFVAAALETGSSPLTPRETEVPRAAATGNRVAQMASDLSLSHATVRNYLSNAISKVGARNRIDAIRISRDAGWL